MSEFVSLLVLSCTAGVAAQTVKPVRLDAFKQGVPFAKAMRFDVKDIIVAARSVRHLFQPVPKVELSTREYYSQGGILGGPTHVVRLVVRGPSELQELQVALASQDDHRVVILLEDHHDGPLQHVLPGALFRKEVAIAVHVTPCDAITRIVAKKINSLIKEETEQSGQTDKRISLNELFDKLLRGEIETYMASLDTVQAADPCFNTFEVLQWLKGDNASGFDSSDYGLNGGLRGLLKPAVDGLLTVKALWSQSHLSVRVLGHTDPIQFREKADRVRREVRRERTSIQDWSKVKEPLNIRYAGCTGDLLDGTGPVYLGLDARDEGTVSHVLREGELVENNCGLGAARAYVAMVYLVNTLGLDSVEYSYATGGASRAGVDQRIPDAKKRKVDIEFVLKAARKGR